MVVTKDLFKNEGPRALYKGITPRVLRVAPGQAIVFTVSHYLPGHARTQYRKVSNDFQVYERVKKWIDQAKDQYQHEHHE
jgi:solute carrier family 25 citrate transporter 1